MQSMTKYYLLAALSRQEMHGYHLIQELEKITGKKPSTGQIYPVLKEMQKSGYITMKASSNGKKKIKYYKMTKSGEKFFAEMTKRFSSLIEATIKAKVKVCAHCGCEMIKGSVSKKIKGKKLDFCCNSCAGSFSRHL
ncbi:MAG: PadR family transcriptional regulator [Candidatus Aenigmarchaeota archaeon]|nr:PadR family transcriptional regulator [Candidatus Aenigmarchaeota archaeon]